jgi:hypothetical protein
LEKGENKFQGSVRHLKKKQVSLFPTAILEKKLSFTVFVHQYEKNKCLRLCPPSWKKKKKFQGSVRHLKKKQVSLFPTAILEKKLSFMVFVHQYEQNKCLRLCPPSWEKN